MGTQHVTDPLQLQIRTAEESGDPKLIQEAYRRVGQIRSSEARNRIIDPPFQYTEVVAGTRQTGKTHFLVEWVKAGRGTGTLRTIVCLDQGMARQLIRDHGLSPDEAVAFRSLRSPGGRHTARRQYAIDEAAETLAMLLGLPDVPALVAITTPSNVGPADRMGDGTAAGGA